MYLHDYYLLQENIPTRPKIFFNLGPKNDWRSILGKKNREKIEECFKEEMCELGYLKL